MYESYLNNSLIEAYLNPTRVLFKAQFKPIWNFLAVYLKLKYNIPEFHIKHIWHLIQITSALVPAKHGQKMEYNILIPH